MSSSGHSGTAAFKDDRKYSNLTSSSEENANETKMSSTDEASDVIDVRSYMMASSSTNTGRPKRDIEDDSDDIQINIREEMQIESIRKSNWVVRDDSVRDVPPYYPMEKSSRVVESQPSVIAARISDCCRAMSVQAHFDNEKVRNVMLPVGLPLSAHISHTSLPFSLSAGNGVLIYHGSCGDLPFTVERHCAYL